MPNKSNESKRTPEDLAPYPKWDERMVTLEWDDEWWDGPMDGLIKYNSQAYWFAIHCSTDERGNPYYYLVYPLSEEETAFANGWFQKSEEFRRKYEAVAKDSASAMLPPATALVAEWEMHRATLPNFTQRKPVAWFRSGGNSSFAGIQLT